MLFYFTNLSCVILFVGIILAKWENKALILDDDA